MYPTGPTTPHLVPNHQNKKEKEREKGEKEGEGEREGEKGPQLRVFTRHVGELTGTTQSEDK